MKWKDHGGIKLFCQQDSLHVSLYVQPQHFFSWTCRRAMYHYIKKWTKHGVRSLTKEPHKPTPNLDIKTNKSWFSLRRRVGPQMEDVYFDDWWDRISRGAVDLIQKGLNSLVILSAWTLWKHLNRCVFGGASSSLAWALLLAMEDLHLWGLAGAWGVNFLLALMPEEGWPACV